MERSNYSLPDFCRVSWVSDAAKAKWTPVFQAIVEAWDVIEVESVAKRMRRLALHSMPLDRTPSFLEWCKERDLGAKALYTHKRSAYISDRNQFNRGADVTVYAVGRRRDVEAGELAYREGRNADLGDLLGYPTCCTEFFREVWVGERHIDTTWPMAKRSEARTSDDDRTLSRPVASQTNMLLRWLGIRPVFHLPCAFDCIASHSIANELTALAKDSRCQNAFAQLHEVLGWSMQWSALHGIAEIETPVLKISARTDATRYKYTVRLIGDSEIIEAPMGTRFPYRTTKREMLPVRRAINRDDRLRRDSIDHEYGLNFGFASQRDLRAVTWPLLKIALSSETETLMHIACKNGALLAEAYAFKPNLKLIAVEDSGERLEEARNLLPSDALICAGSYTDIEFIGGLPATDICVLSVGRLLELSVPLATRVLDALREKCRWLYVYAFSDWKNELQNLPMPLNSQAYSGDPIQCEGGSSLLRIRGTLGTFNNDLQTEEVLDQCDCQSDPK